MSDSPLTLADSLHQLTSARVALGNSGPAIPTREHLRFQLDHAQARDAVHAHLDVSTLLQQLRARDLNPIALHSQATKKTYLRRPDLGRRLTFDSAKELQHLSPASESTISVILTDGLSALAVDRHALPLLDATLPLLQHEHLAPVSIVTQGRVAIGDEIGTILRAQLTILLIGERPGLSSPDSLGIYITWNPRPGCTDAERNCISNIRHEGLNYAEAAQRIVCYIRGARQIQATGVTLKEMTALPRESTT